MFSTVTTSFNNALHAVTEKSKHPMPYLAAIDKTSRWHNFAMRITLQSTARIRNTKLTMAGAKMKTDRHPPVQGVAYFPFM